MSKNSNISQIHADLILIHKHSKIRLTSVDDKITAVGGSLTNVKENDLKILHLSVWLEYTKVMLEKIEKFLSSLYLVSTKKYYSELNNYKRIYRDIEENPKKEDSKLLIATKTLFGNAESLLHDLESSKRDFDNEFKLKFLGVYGIVAGIVSSAFLLSGLPSFLNLNPLGTCISLAALLYFVYILLKNYLCAE